MVTNTGAAESDEVPPTQFAPARGARIAYQDFGQGPIVVAVPPMAQNIEMAWEWPAVRAMFERFGSFSRWIQFDKRGTGASDRRSRIPGIDERVDDLRAIMDHAEVERAFLYGASEGGPMCLLFAATYPDRVQGLILHGSSACFTDEDLTDEERIARKQGADLMIDTWGTPESILAPLFSPSLAEDAAYRQWLQRYERLSTDRESLRELMDILYDFDVREVLPELDVPTLVMHRTGDQVIPVAHARAMADAIPGARLVEHEGIDHFGFAGDMGWLDDLERFVTGTVQTSRARASGPTVRIQTFGRFAVTVDGREVPTSAWGGRLARRLCKRLVAARGWPVTREELFELLWPGDDDLTKLGARLSVQLSTVRRILHGAVIADRQTVALNLDEVTTDLEEFHTAETEEDTIAAYFGDFLVEDVSEDWTAGARDEARGRFTRAARSQAQAAADRGDTERALELGRRLLAVDRYDDQAHRLVIEVLVTADLPGEARQAHRAWAEAMDELDLEVPDLDQL